MFDGDYTIYGDHASKIKYLVNDAKAFKRYIDVYMAGAVMGALHERRSKHTDSSDRARIYADAFTGEQARCKELFRTIILTDTSKPWTPEERINICFRYRDHEDKNAVPPISREEISMMKEAMSLFHEYVLGGIELLYDRFSSSAAIDIDDAVDYAYKTLFDQHALIESYENDGDEAQLFRPEY